ncbi:MAG TPA: phytanoyl-CoA dioxygenase family protein [Thermoanaerobaculia bacterium]|jgi:polysaccharide pyruvyl transferase WcaK-like protein
MVADVGAEPFHVGDEAMLVANVEALRRHDPDVRVTVIGRDPGGTAGLPKAVAAALEGADGLFLSGGGNLSSSWPELLGQRIGWMREARRRGLPIVTGGQTIGPELSTADRSALAKALAGVDHLGVRELPSAALALRMGVPAERLSYQPDDAFFLAGRPPAAEERIGCPDEPFLLVTLDPAFAAVDSRPGLCSLALQLARMAAESGLRLAFLPHVGPLGSLGDEDGRAGAALGRLLEAEGVECALLPVMRPAETVWVTQRAAAVVSSRYHPLVFGAAAAVPCLGIYRDDYTRIKLQGALTHLGMEAWCQSAADAERFGLVRAFRDLWNQREEIAAAMTRAREPLEAQEERRWRRLLARLGWLRDIGDQPERPAASLLGWPAGHTGRLAAAALSALVLERQASEAEAAHWRGVVSQLERTAGHAAQAVRGRERRTMEATRMLTEQQWNDYSRDGYLHLGKVLEPEELEALRQRADDLALGNVKNPDVQMQLDTGGVYEELPTAVRGFERGTRLYRKIQGLETDDLFVGLVKHPLFLEICARQYGPHAPISIFRAMVMNKPAGQGTVLPWHQDGGNVWALDRDPLVTIWVALDTATRANGCMEVVPGTHRLGLLSLYGSTVEEEHVKVHCPPERVQPLEVEAGHAVLLHNWLIHRSGVNPTSGPRRALTVCYMDGRTQSILTGNHFPLVAGSLPAEPYPFIHQLRQDCATWRAAATRQMWKVGLQQLRGGLSRVRARLAAARRWSE